MTEAVLQTDPEHKGGLSPGGVDRDDGLTRALARYAVGVRYASLPSVVRHEAARAFLNWIGVAIGGSEEEASRIAARYVAEKHGGQKAALIGHRLMSDVASAAFVNCISSSVLAYDDAHLPTVAHPSGPAAAALFALAQTRPIDGEAFLRALALGIEMQCRVANMLVQPPSPIDPNFYVNGFSGPIGVAAAVGCLVGLDEQHMVWAIGLAASQASGFRSTHGTMTAHFRPGYAAQAGVLAALLAAHGFDCTDNALEAPGGFIDVYAKGTDAAIALDGLGERHEMLENRYKPYPCGIVIHPVIDACQQALAQLPVGATLARIQLIVNPLVLKLTGKPTPQTPLESHVSVFHWAAVALLGRSVGLAATQTESIFDPTVVALRDRIGAEADPRLGKGEAKVQIILADGAVIDAHVTHARGSRERPMTDSELDAKFDELAMRKLSRDASDRLRDACWQVAGMADVGLAIGPLLP
ncbi:MmgE/PrpD family protein [Sphingobium sp. H39-3-25]|uniref:MmgE/PrpD family protein n=1 Tax=Sphingobium arseniciresistens TaxID=3030834 RepID=UPI0023B8CD59|nr:MmgE/PrpD family protein [Sphingobium arseniciresistens]